MLSIRAALAGIALMAAAAVPATAADLGGMDEAVMDHGVSHGGRFYLRGDLNYAWHRAPDMVESGINLTDTKLGNSWGYGGGIGWYLSPNWRMDVTVERRNDAAAYGYLTVPGDANLTGTRDFSIYSTTALANLYYDFSGRAGFNPYVGAGIGWSTNTTRNGTAVDLCNCVSTIEGASQSNFAWALMAGFTRELDRGFSLDAGYRLLNIGKAHTGNLVMNTGAVVPDSDPDVSTIYANEVRVGLRYDFN